MNVEQTLEMARRTDLLPATLPFFWVAVIFILAAALWLGLRHVTRKYAAKLPFYGMFAPRLVGAVAASWAGFQVIGRFLEYGCRWPIWGAALATGFAVELTAGLYLRERRVIPDRLGLILTTLRSLVIALTAVLIMQPTWVRMKERHFERRVAVLFDDTQSMQFKDELWTVSEKLALGRAFGKVSASDNPLPSLSKLNALQPQLRAFFPTADARVEGDGRITGLLEGGLRSAESLRDELDKCLKDLPQAQQAQRDVLERTRRLVWDQVGASLNSAAQLAKNGTWAELTPGKVMDALRQFEEASALARTAVDEVYWEGLDEAARAAVDALCTTTRVELATRLLTSQDRRGGVFLDKLGARYDVDLFRMGQRIERIPKLGEKTVLVEEEDAPALTNLLAAAVAEEEAVVEAGLPDDPLAPPRRAVAQTQTQWDIRQQASQAFRMSTDFTMGLEGLQKEISQEMLAGAIIVSDGLHNGTASFDPIARRFGAQGVPVMGVRVGGSRLPFDIAVADVIAPESVFLGDNVRVRAIVQATNAKGQKLNVHLCFEGSSNVVETVVMEVTSDNWHQEHRFKHQPEAQGIVRYEVRTDVLEGELFDDNNAWAVDVAVSDDRTNVLLLDEMPRWEFRYLRNLFFGRDKSVHLQYYLNRPDTLADTPPPLLPPASATRKFGDAEAGDLPDSREEWRRFDVIILGDLPPTVLTEEVLEDIYHCVSDRGALLVMIAGPESMPHAYPDDSLLWKMLPLTLDPSHVMF
ncbi:MAG: hypothetical protein FWF96_08265, partial [Kiritimatiellaeota bacterium]|nr:hypothetical protein [Kiritimatiellota bacterium]